MCERCPVLEADLERERHRVKALIVDLENLETERRAGRRREGQLKAELANQREQSPDAQQAKDVFDHWREKLNKRSSVVFGPAREKAVLARLREFPLAELKRAVDGCALMPFVGPHGRQSGPGKGAKRYDDLALICRDETTVERFVGYVEQQESDVRVRQAIAEEDVANVYGRDTVTGEVRWNGSYRDDGDFRPGGLHALLDGLERVGSDVRGSGAKFMAQCPAHEDRDPSLSILEKPDGRVLLYCWAGCKTLDVLHAVDLEFTDIGGACALDVGAAQRTFGEAA